MSAWLEIHQSLPSHRKTFAVCDLLELEPYQVVGHLACFWMWALDNAPTGRLDGVGVRVIAIAANWRGDAASFTDALVSARFLDRDENGLAIHNWDLYAGKLLEHRKNERERLREHRANVKRTSAERAANDTITKEEHTPNVQVSYAVRTECVEGTGPNRTGPYRTQPKENEESHDSSAHAPVLPFEEYADKLRGKAANHQAIVLSEAITAIYGRECGEYSRLAKLAKSPGAGKTLEMVFSCKDNWNGIDNPLDYVTKALHSRNGRNGHGDTSSLRSEPYEPPQIPDDAEPLHNEPLNGVTYETEEEETAEDRALVREHQYRLRLDTRYRLWWEESERYLIEGRPAPHPKPPWPAYLAQPSAAVAESTVGT